MAVGYEKIKTKMKSLPNLNDILSDPSRASDLSPIEAGEMLAKVAAIQTILMGRVLSGSPGHSTVNEDRLLDVVEASKILNCTEDWLYRNAKKLPFAKRISVRQLRFSSHGIERYIKNRNNKAF